MKERPILFSAPMVCALLAGTKSQTRRLVKGDFENFEEGWSLNGGDPRPTRESWSPYGQPRARLWVRETWRTDFVWDDFSPIHIPQGQPLKFEADQAATACVAFEWGRIRQSIFMRRWMSRITLEIVDVRVERLQEITEADASAEGTPAIKTGGELQSDGSLKPLTISARTHYRSLWNKLNPKQPWDANPWVWVVEFKRVEVAA